MILGTIFLKLKKIVLTLFDYNSSSTSVRQINTNHNQEWLYWLHRERFMWNEEVSKLHNSETKSSTMTISG